MVEKLLHTSFFFLSSFVTKQVEFVSVELGKWMPLLCLYTFVLMFPGSALVFLHFEILSAGITLPPKALTIEFTISHFSMFEVCQV